mmetsp:Transcript_28772/g.52056  ORF Transcript_28772/g.52056 Transcript_28772/m.52056 type:complete len:196 (+) Transcript_28772:29-616(+)
MKALSLASLFLFVLATSASAFVPRRQQQHHITSKIKSWTTRVDSISSNQSNSNDMLVDAAFIGVGAVTGAVCRYQIGNIVTRKIQEHPRLTYFQGWHTAGINILGSFVLGTLAGVPTVDPAASHDKRGITARSRLLAGVGFCGSFTTFSTFAVDVVGMLNKGEMTRAFSYMALNNVGGVMAAFAGFNLAKRILSK